MDEQTFLQLVADILEVDTSEVDLGGDLETLGWDSLSNISFIAEIDERVGVAVDPDALANAVTVADLRALAAGA